MSGAAFHPGFTQAEAAGYLAAVPWAWRGRVGGRWSDKRDAAKRDGKIGADRFDGFRAADSWLVETSQRMRSIRVPLTLSDGELCELAKRCAADCMDIAYQGPSVTLAALREAMAAYVRRYGIEPPAPRELSERTGKWSGVTDAGALRRMGDGQWWRRRLRVTQGRAIEREAIRLGYVSKRQEIYASELTVERRAQQKRRNAAGLEKTTAVNQFGDEFTLAKLAEKSVANPRIRRGELMTRIAGFDSIARSLDHVGVFCTVTCPSRMHAKAINTDTGAVFDNRKYDGTTPREAARYLGGMWAKCRAALARKGLVVYGFRIAEPHHDGTPHWHVLLFMAEADKADVCRIFAKYARQEDAHEMTSKEARAARFLVKAIEWSRGWSAAGYVAKYISKNVDGGGYQVQGDIEGGEHDAVTPSHRVEAWAAQWGVRQFQQIGGAPVGVWRELRRMKADENNTPTVEAGRIAADVGNWHRYQEVMGGVACKRKDRPLSVARTEAGKRWTGEAAPLNRYGEDAQGAIFGLVDAASGRAFITRVFQWEVRRKNEGVQGGWGVGVFGLSEVGAGVCGWAVGEFTAAEDCASEASQGRGLGFELGRLAGSWSPVNNCTEGGEDECFRTGAESEICSASGAFVAGGGADTRRGARRDARASRNRRGAGARSGRNAGA